MPTPHDPRPKPRKRPRNRGGAPRGNQNARKHGRYSPAVQPDQEMELRAFSQDIALPRVRLRALLRDPNSSLDQINELLDVIGKAVGISDSCSDDR